MGRAGLSKSEVDALGVITISRGCFERCCSNKKTPPYHSNLSFVTLRNRRPTPLRASAYRTPSKASPRRRCGHASRFLWTRPSPRRKPFLFFCFQVPDEYRDLIHQGLILTYAINAAAAIYARGIAETKQQPVNFWCGKVFLFGGLALGELVQVQIY